MTLPWVIAGAVAGLLAGPRIRASVFTGSATAGQPPRRHCPACSAQILPDRWRWRSLLPVTGRCPACQARIGPYPLVVELAAAGALAAVAARAPSGWELAALAWLTLIAVPLAAAAFAGHEPGRLARAAVGAAALTCFYLALCLIRPGEMGLGEPSSPPASAWYSAGLAGGRCFPARSLGSPWPPSTVPFSWPRTGQGWAV